MSSAPYQAAAGPSRYLPPNTYLDQRHYSPDLPPPPPSKSPSPAPSPIDAAAGGAPPWSNGHGHPDAGGDAAKRNPLVDLIDTEKVYVEQLGLVIRRVAAAWSRKDFPPPKLDAMFRCVEAVYRANRSFGNKLKEIGPNPSSPKALGDLLMRWIDDLEPSYSKYCSTFMSGFDSYPPVTVNQLLPNILSEISSSSPPTPPLDRWSLDALFLLPYTRLRYYRKLYARLLRSTKEGRSDHRLLLVANQRLEALVSECEGRLEVDVGEEDDRTSRSAPASEAGQRSREQSWVEREKERISRSSSAMGSSNDSHGNFSPFSSRVEDPRHSSGTAASSISQSPQRRPGIKVPTMTAPPSITTPVSPVPISDLELRIDTERTIDLFTMNPKKCKLQMNPATLPFERALRSSHDVTIHFTPSSTGQPVTHRRAHVFILSDLFLVAEWMEVADKAAKAQEQIERMGTGGAMPEMWLCYPPLAGKHLAIAEGSQGNVLTVTIMRKETFVIHAENEVARDQILKDLVECIDFAMGLSRQNTMQSPAIPDARSPSSLSDGRSVETTFPPLRYPSPFSPASSSPSGSPMPQDTPEMHPPPTMGGPVLATQMSRMNLEPGETVQWQPPPPPAPTLPNPGVAVLPPRGASLRMRQTSGPVPGNGMPMYSQSQPPPVPMDPSYSGAALPRSASGRSVQSAPRSADYDVPPVPTIRAPGSHLSDGGLMHPPPHRSRSADPLRPPEPPSARFSSFPSLPEQAAGPSDDLSPPSSPVEEDVASLTGPSAITAQMKCKVFLKQSHQQWKSLGSAKLKLYAQKTGPAAGGSTIKQLVVESDSSGKAMLISTIVLTDGVERVAKTGVAVEISDRGKRTGIVYMIQLRNENSARGLFESLLEGSDRQVSR